MGPQVWSTLKDIGKVQVFDARPPFTVLKTMDTGPMTNHVNIVRNANGQFAYVTVGGLLNEIQVFRTDDFKKCRDNPGRRIAPTASGRRETGHGFMSDWKTMTRWRPSTHSRTVSSHVFRSGEGPQAVVYVPDATPGTRAPGNEAISARDGTVDSETDNLQQLGVAGQVAQLSMGPPAAASSSNVRPPTSVSLFDQGLSQVLQAAATGLEPRKPYVLAPRHATRR